MYQWCIFRDNLDNQRSKRSDTSECPLQFPLKIIPSFFPPKTNWSCIFHHTRLGPIKFHTLKGVLSKKCYPPIASSWKTPPPYMFKNKDLWQKTASDQGSKDPTPPSKIHRRSRPRPRSELPDASHSVLASPQGRRGNPQKKEKKTPWFLCSNSPPKEMNWRCFFFCWRKKSWTKSTFLEEFLFWNQLGTKHVEPWRSIPWVFSVFWNVECLAKDSEKTYMSGNPKRWFLGGILLVEPLLFYRTFWNMYIFGVRKISPSSASCSIFLSKNSQGTERSKWTYFVMALSFPAVCSGPKSVFGRLRQPKATSDNSRKVRSRNHGCGRLPKIFHQLD